MDAIAAAQSLSLQMQEANEITMTRIREKPDGPPAEILTSDDTSDDNIDLKREEKDVTKRKKKKHKHKHKHKKLKHHHKTESPVHSSNKEHSKIPVGAVFLDEIYGLKPEHAYHIDRKKNKDLWVYKSISSRHIAKYRSFSRNCLGSSQLFLDNKDSRKTKNNNDFARYFGKVGRLQVYIKGTSLAVEVPEQSNNVDFIPLPRLADAKALQSEESVFMYGVRNEAISLYVQGKGAYHKNSAESDVTQDKDFVLDEMFEKIRCFNQRTRDEPENVSLWLEFVAFQDIVAQREKAGGSAASVSQTANLRELYRPTRSVIDKKLAILDKALDSNPSCLELKLAQLELYQDIWERDKLEKAWENLLFVHSGKVELWQEYLAKQQCSRLQGFTVSGAVKRFHKCFQTLTSIMDGTVKVIQKEPNMEEKTIVSARWVPKMLSDEHKRQRVEISQILLHRCQQEGDETVDVGPGGDHRARNKLLEHLISGDETWLHLSIPETKRDSMTWKHPSSPV
ncbi:protein nrde2 homolog [Plakobranchus ocellatus]|uniref:Protein nrde2 homolog n=1 Tax=Plakobranchus ocellatus TaxID=259542 RepID=A0AAV3ZPI9_9GAST|nr:protein nrde2 homolog [Plakobranchus ocellatus]